MPGRLPNFFLVGAPKAGTTSLYHWLDRHPQIYMSPVKEPCYFASELRAENFVAEEQPRLRREQRSLEEYLRQPVLPKRFGALIAEWDAYASLYRGASDHTAVGEATVCYLWSPTAAANIREKIPGAKIVMVLRNPVERAFSQYLHALTLGTAEPAFREHVRASQRAGPLYGRLHPFLEFGLYHPQVRRYLNLFPREAVRIYFYEDYRRDPGALYADLCSFLGVDAAPEDPEDHRHMEPRLPRFGSATSALKRAGLWQRVRRLSPAPALPLLRRLIFQNRETYVMTAQDRKYLAGYYRDDVCALSRLVGRDLSHWLAAD